MEIGGLKISAIVEHLIRKPSGEWILPTEARNLSKYQSYFVQQYG